MLSRRDLIGRAAASGVALSALRCASAPARAFGPVAGLAASARPLDSAELALHLERVQRGLALAGIDALLVEPGRTMLYLSGVAWAPSERLFLLIVPARGAPRWIAPAFEEARARERTGPQATIELWQEHEDPYQLLSRLVPGSGPVAVDPAIRQLIAAGAERVLAPRRIVSGLEAIRAARIVKTERELALL
jgi:Xaa-Pro dipeptidase